jgi:hypothetical protein
MVARGFSVQILFVLSGLIVWAIHLLLIYIFNALACARGFADIDILGIGIAPLAIVVLGVVSLAVLAGVIAVAATGSGPFGSDDSRSEGFLRYLTISIAALSGVAVVWETIPVFILPPCG